MATVLVVEDQKNQRLLYRMELEEAGYRVVEAEDARAALMAVMQDVPDVVVLDPPRQEAECIQILEGIKTANPDMPVVVYTGYSLYETVSQHWGADACVIKNSNLEFLKNAVHRVLAQERGTDREEVCCNCGCSG